KPGASSGPFLWYHVLVAAVVDQISDLVPRMQELPLRMDDSALVGGQEPDRFAETDLAALDINRMPQLEAVRRLLVLGRTYYDQGNLEDAAECFRKALDLRPNGFAALYALGVIAGQLKRYEESKEAFERLVPLLEPLGDAVDNTLVASVRQGIGVALLGLWGATGPQEPPPELARRAEREFRRALELDPNDVGAWIGLGVALHIMERVDDAEAAFRKALE